MSVRKQILLDDSQVTRLQQLRRRTGNSESEIVRRALEAYDPDGMEPLEGDAEIVELVQALEAQNARTHHALDVAEREVAETLKHFEMIREERAGEQASSGAGQNG